MAASPRVNKMPPKKLQPSKCPFPLSGSGIGTAVVEVVLVVVAAVVVVVVVGSGLVVVSGSRVVVVLVVVVLVVVVLVVVVDVVVSVVVVVSCDVVVGSEGGVRGMVVGGMVVGGVVVSSPDPGHDSVVLNIFDWTESAVTSLSSWQISEVSLYVTNTHPFTATHFLHSAWASQVTLVVAVLDGEMLEVEEGSVVVGKPKTWQPKTNPTRRYLSMLRLSCL